MNLARPPIGKAVALVEANCGGLFVSTYITASGNRYSVFGGEAYAAFLVF